MKDFVLGDIVLLKFPFTDGLRAKKRPAMVILDDGKKDLIVARITSKKCDGNFDVELEDWEEEGLLAPSWVRLHKVATLEKCLVEKKLGRLYGFDAEDVIRVFAEMYLDMMEPIKTVTISRPHYDLLIDVAQCRLDLSQNRYEKFCTIEELMAETDNENKKEDS